MFSTNDTIVAVATPPGRGGLAVLRISGAGAVDVAARLCGPTRLDPRRATLVRVVASSDVTIDEAVATFFKAPQSYTAEDVVEVSVHGSPAIVALVLEAAVRAGARLAGPGEFTLRAYLNGRLDLIQAEAVGDLVAAATPLQARVAFDQLDGTLSRAIGAIEAQVFDLRARLEASIDFPEEGYRFVEPEALDGDVRAIAMAIESLLCGARAGRMLRDGWRVAVVGPPNVGKSTLFNWVVGVDRAIVSSQPGTTRDLVTATVDVGGFVVDLVDTAGVRGTDDEVEREGVARARQAAEAADLALVVCDVSEPRAGDADEILGLVPDRDRFVVLNKRDRGVHPSWRMWLEDRPGSAVCVSLRSGEGTDELRRALHQRLAGGRDVVRDRPMVTNLRHDALLRRAAAAIERMSAALTATPAPGEEVLLVDLGEAAAALEEVVGRRSVDDVLAHIFSRFCVGK